MSDSLFKELGNQRVAPQPERSSIGQGGITYIFPASSIPARVEFAMEPSFPGLHGFQMQVQGMQRTGARVLVMP